MATGILGTAITGLMAFQRSLDTTSHNIANVNTEGYSRQRVELGTMPAEYTGAGYVGNGVKIENIARIYDDFVNKQLRSSTSAFGEADKFYAMATQVDNIMADDDSGLAPMLKSFFNAVNDAASDPTSIPARQAMLSEAEMLNDRFHTIAGRLNSFRDQVNSDLKVSVDEINSLAQEIAELNKQIVAGIGRTSGERFPNDLLDKRDLLLNKLAEQVDVSVVPQDDGAVNVFIGQGQALVLAGRASTMSLVESGFDVNHKDIEINGEQVTRFITGGELGGVLRFRDEILDPAQKQLGIVAAGLTVEFNAQHRQGFDLNGVTGQDFFAPLQPAVIEDPAFNSGGDIDVVFDGGSLDKLQASDYRLDYDGSSYTLTRLSDQFEVFSGAGLPQTVDGMIFSEVTAPSGADSFLIRPTFNAAEDMALDSSMDNPNKIALAQALDGLPGDNRNALALAALELKPGMSAGKTLDQIYGQLVSKIGGQTRSAEVSQNAQQALLNQATEERENLSGVNLDEEAANLIKFQNAYQASAQTITVARTIFDTLIGAVR